MDRYEIVISDEQRAFIQTGLETLIAQQHPSIFATEKGEQLELLYGMVKDLPQDAEPGVIQDFTR